MKAKIIFTTLLICSSFMSINLVAQSVSYDHLTLGKRSTSTSGNVTRMTLIPFKHSNSWLLNTRDTQSDAYLDVLYGVTQQITFKWNTGVGIGTNNPQYKLDVNGTIRAKEVIVSTGWADFVFEDNYKLPSLYEVKEYIITNKHLSGIPSEAEVKENGANLGEVVVKLLQKVEELTLYSIQQQERIDELERNQELIKEMQ